MIDRDNPRQTGKSSPRRLAPKKRGRVGVLLLLVLVLVLALAAGGAGL